MTLKPELRPVPGRPRTKRTVNVYIDGYNFYVPFSTMSASEYELAWCNFWRLSEYLLHSLQTERQAFTGCELGVVKYFTASLPENAPKNQGGIQRKRDWLDALNHESGGRVEVVHGTFRRREHRFYIERDELDESARSGIPVNWDLLDSRATFHPHMTVREEKQTDVMLGCALVTDSALGHRGVEPALRLQEPPQHLSNARPTPSACHAAILISADIDFVPAAEIAASCFACPVVIAFAFPHTGFILGDVCVQTADIATRHISEAELRACMLKAEVVTPKRTITLAHFKRSHFERRAATGG